MSACTCFPVPEHYHTTHYGATDPATTLEPNPDCPEHFPAPAPEGKVVPYARDLLALADGARVKDIVGDRWEKRDGWWYCYDAALRGEALLRVWGPVTLTSEPAVVTYGEDQG